MQTFSQNELFTILNTIREVESMSGAYYLGHGEPHSTDLSSILTDEGQKMLSEWNINRVKYSDAQWLAACRESADLDDSDPALELFGDAVSNNAQDIEPGSVILDECNGITINWTDTVAVAKRLDDLAEEMEESGH